MKSEHNNTILIVDDSPTQVKIVKSLLDNHNYKTFVCVDGLEALGYLKDQVPRLIISDVVMPELNGFQLCKRIKQNERLKNIPVILLTTLSNPNDIINGLNCGADNFITKPFDPEFLLSQVTYLLENKKIREQNNIQREEEGFEVVFAGKKHIISCEKMQIIDLLLSTFETAININRELEKNNRELKEALEKIHTLHGLIPICANCKKVRTNEGYWQQVEHYIEQHSVVDFTHTLCPDCDNIQFKK